MEARWIRVLSLWNICHVNSMTGVARRALVRAPASAPVECRGELEQGEPEGVRQGHLAGARTLFDQGLPCCLRRRQEEGIPQVPEGTYVNVFPCGPMVC
jgi:hypothetical protein